MSAERGEPGSAGGAWRFGAAAPVSAVLFDYGLTLAHFVRPAEAIDAAQRAIASLIEAAGHPRPSVAALDRAVHARVAADVAAHEASGALEEIDVAELQRRAFAVIGLHLDADLLDQCSALVQEAWWRGVRLYPDARPTLQALRDSGLRTGVCSNAPYRAASMHGQLAHVGLDGLLDAAVFSGEVGWRKPSPRLFAAALAALGAGAHETVFIGDRVREDVTGAALAGMRTVLVVRNGSAPEVSDQDGPDAIVHGLDELPALLLGPDTHV